MQEFKNTLKFIVLILIMISANTSFAQTDVDEKLALQFYQNSEYAKAAELYERVYKKKATPFYYNYLLDCYFELEDYKKAKKFVSSVKRMHPNNVKYMVEEAYVIQRSGNVVKAEKDYNKLIKKLNSNRKQVINLSEAFAARNLDDFAIKTLLKNSKDYDNPPLNIELANLYYKTGSYQ